MSGNYIKPDSESVAKLLAMIFGDDLIISSVEAANVSGERLATIIDDDDKLVVICICDLEFLAYSGAALSMIPAAGAEDMIASKTVTEAVANNFHEVMNMCTKLFMSDSSAHLRLDQTLDCEQGAEELSTIDSYATKLGFEVGVPGYGKGRLALFMN